jgi:hypothetical protein
MGKTSAKRISRRKSALTERGRSSYIEKDCFEKSRKCCSTGDSRTEDPVCTKTVRRELHKSSIYGRLSCNCFTESTAQMCQRWCHDHKAWTSDEWKSVILLDGSSALTLLPTSGRVYVWRTLSSQCLVPAESHDTWDVSGSSIVVFY